MRSAAFISYAFVVTLVIAGVVRADPGGAHALVDAGKSDGDTDEQDGAQTGAGTSAIDVLEDAASGALDAGEPTVDAGEPALDAAPLAVDAAPPAADGSTAPPKPDKSSRHDDSSFDYVTPRIEPAGFPLIGGDSDIGVEFGGVATISKFGKGIRPYEWNMDILAALSVKSNPAGHPEITQQNYLWQIDVPGLAGGGLRVTPTVSYTSTINAGYFGLGNASSPNRPAVVTGDPGRFFQYEDRTALVRNLTRVRLRPPFDLMIAANYRYATPSAYAGSQLAADAATGRVRGLAPMSLILLGGGIVYDSRDNEYFPHDGSFHQIGIRGVEGFPFENGVGYGAFGAIFAIYRSIGGPFVLAARGVLDAEFGNVPFYDLFMGEPFAQDQIIGGSAGVRGVPEGRYLGRLKIIGNVELRAMLVDFRFLRQEFHLGGNVLFDTGRTWLDYTFAAPEDGSGLGLKWGAGMGFYLRWGQAAVFRIEAAYSPDAVSENPSFPIGLYVQDGVMF